jgi:hypothetical protein
MPVKTGIQTTRIEDRCYIWIQARIRRVKNLYWARSQKAKPMAQPTPVVVR